MSKTWIILPEQDTYSFFCVLDDGETFSGAENARISVWDDEVSAEAFEGVSDFDDAYDSLEKDQQPLDIPLGVVIKYLRKDWGRFTTYCRENDIDLGG